MTELALRATLAALGVALAAAPLGCHVVWRRMAFFSDATAHAAILGVALALAIGAAPALGALLAALAVALLAAGLTARGRAADTALGVLAHGGLALGLVAAALLGLRVDVEALLLGDVLAVSRGDVALIWGGAALIWALLLWRWGRLLTATLGDDLAAAAGIDPARERLILTLALALLVAIALQVVGALLIGALLLIPAAAARPFARTPEGMAALAALLGAGAALGGMRAAWALDLPAGPAIAATAALVFALSAGAAGVYRWGST